MPFPPEAFIIGAQRAGTTSLSSILDQHPDIVLSTPKEPDFFSVNWDRGFDWYRSCFRRVDATLIDASVNYTMARLAACTEGQSDLVPRRIHQVSPEARFVYLVRDPAERCYSAYWHEVRSGREDLSLEQAVSRPRYYVMASFYAKQLKLFLDIFPLDRFLFVQFSDFVRDPLSVARRCSEFFGVTRDFAFRTEEPRNQAFTYSSLGLTLRNLVGEERLKGLSSIVSSILPSSLHPYAKRIVSRAIPELTMTDRIWLDQHFAADACEFQHLTGVRVAAGHDKPNVSPSIETATTTSQGNR
jgi:Sulfotransferase domain